MSGKKNIISVLVILLLPMFLSYLSPLLYRIVLEITYQGQVELINKFVSDSIAYILIMNHFCVFMIIVIYMKRKAISWNHIGVSIEKMTWIKALGGVIIGVGCFSILNLLPTIYKLVELPKSNNGNGFVFFLASISVAPIIEELIFRGFGMSQLSKRIGRKKSIIITALCFSLLHIYNGLPGLLTAFIAGIVLAMTLIKTESVYPCIIAHFTMNISIGILYIITAVK